jgi:hypothetical protein
MMFNFTTSISLKIHYIYFSVVVVSLHFHSNENIHNWMMLKQALKKSTDATENYFFPIFLLLFIKDEEERNNMKLIIIHFHSYYSDRGTCVKCYLSCDTCSGPRRDQCVTCPKDWKLAGGECHPECPEGYFKTEFGCQRCHHYCKTCNGKSHKSLYCLK